MLMSRFPTAKPQGSMTRNPNKDWKWQNADSLDQSAGQFFYPFSKTASNITTYITCGILRNEVGTPAHAWKPCEVHMDLGGDPPVVPILVRCVAREPTLKTGWHILTLNGHLWLRWLWRKGLSWGWEGLC